jgi:lipopolysaccharide transport system ATP-binding protein
MSLIDFKDVTLDFPIYNSSNRSLKKRLFKVATGGQLNEDARGHMSVRALENLSFSIGDGDRVALLGHNGAGKSTLLRLLSGVYAPSSGTVEIAGRIGSLIDISLGIDVEASGRENVFLRAALLGIRRAEVDRRFEDICEFAELGDFIDMPVRTYSSGMHLRLAFAVSTLIYPEILLMDEWLAVGDEGFRHKAEARMDEIVRTTSILVIATHSRDLVLKVCNRAIWLEHGRIRMDGDANAVADAYFH